MSFDEHICEVCDMPSHDHEAEPGQSGAIPWPAPCCHGCPCGSFEEAYGSTIFDRTPIGHVLLDPQGDPWIRVPGGVVEVVMRPSSGGPPVRILHPSDDFAECEREFGPFSEVEDA